MKNLVLILGIVLYSSNGGHAQAFVEWTWKHRIIVITSSSDENTKYLEQLQVLRSARTKWPERKIKVVHELPDGCFEGLDTLAEISGKRSDVNADSNFEIRLIGLDGGVKLSSNSVVQAEDIIALIDSMPMRQTEIRNQKNHK